MIPGVAFDDTSLSASSLEVKPAAEISGDPKDREQPGQPSARTASATASRRDSANPYMNFGDRFSPESALTVLDAQESLPAPPRTGAAAAAETAPENTRESSDEDKNNRLDTNGDGMVSFVEWLNRDEATA
ncbi:hypothetical protein [Oleispirillum naphthae]|uniref:hypothetical protein n=1 Tax=Oleispirillum naphthae TaxID=2838853 RepID=UPI0030825645